MRILFTTTGHAGHALPLVPFARACLRAGHDVHIATKRSRMPALERTGVPLLAFDDPAAEELGPLFAARDAASFEEVNDGMAREMFGELESGGSASAAGSTDSPTRVLGRFKDRAVDITTNDSDPLTLSVPAGNYAILAKATVGGIGLATCRLLAGDDFDETSFNNPTIKSTTSTLTLTVLHSSDASFKARLRCGDGKRDGSLIGFLEDIKLTAVKVDQLSNKAG